MLLLKEDEKEQTSALKENEMKYETRLSLTKKEIENYKIRLADKEKIIKAVQVF